MIIQVLVNINVVQKRPVVDTESTEFGQPVR